VRAYATSNGDSGLARRYHWLSHDLESFVETPHSANDGTNRAEIVNLTDACAKASRSGQLELLCEFGPDRITQELIAFKCEPAPVEPEPLLPHPIMSVHQDVRPKGVMMRCLHGAPARGAGGRAVIRRLHRPGMAALLRVWWAERLRLRAAAGHP